MPHDLAFTVEDGKIRFIYHPNDLVSRQAIETMSRVLEDKRAGYVWPRGAAKRLAFRLIRAVFGSRGEISDWTRRWGGSWVVIDAETMEQLPGIYPSHDDGVEAEVVWSLHHGYPRRIIE